MPPDTPAPTVELDSAAHAAYLRFTRKPVARTEPVDTEGCIVTADFDQNGHLVGIELIGVEEFGVSALLKRTGIRRPPARLVNNARYVPADLVPA
ncbi:MAG TPA: DUF2283 domain-containing protein [Candidatus Synoicihabitans sp.]|nr:DUF2283 domain-containing protein [Candidatus Synoicihabitans sp.]